MAIQQSDNSQTVRNPELSARPGKGSPQATVHPLCERALAASKLGEPERQTLLAIAEKLRIAAETFAAFLAPVKNWNETLLLYVSKRSPWRPCWNQQSRRPQHEPPPPTPHLPQAAGELEQQLTKASTELREATRFRKEFDRQLSTLIGHDALRNRNKDTKNAFAIGGPGQGGRMSQILTATGKRFDLYEPSNT